MNPNQLNRKSTAAAAVSQLSRKESLRWLEVSFTDTSFAAIRAYRVQASLASRRPVSFAQALDALIKSHPFVTGQVAE